jgi:hypothetical protein
MRYSLWDVNAASIGCFFYRRFGTTYRSNLQGSSSVRRMPRMVWMVIGSQATWCYPVGYWTVYVVSYFEWNWEHSWNFIWVSCYGASTRIVDWILHFGVKLAYVVSSTAAESWFVFFRHERVDTEINFFYIHGSVHRDSILTFRHRASSI